MISIKKLCNSNNIVIIQNFNGGPTFVKQILISFSFQIKCIFKTLSTTSIKYSDDLIVHRDSKENNPNTPFEFTDENKLRLKAIVKNYPLGAQRSAATAYLDMVKRQINWVPISAMHVIAEMLDVPRMRIYELATFYSMMNRKPRGKYHVNICTCTPCWLRGSDLILKAAEEACGCTVGSTSCDGLFGLFSVECQGACVNAPLMVIGDDYYEDLMTSDVHKIIETIRSGGIPPCGPQSSRTCAEPITGQTTLLSEPPPPNHKLLQILQSGPPC